MNIIKKKNIVFGLLAVFLVVVSGYYVFKSVQYQHQFLPGTTAAGVSIGDQSVEEANAALQDYYHEVVFTGIENDEPLFTFTVADIGSVEDFTQQLETLLEDQNPWSWPAKITTAAEEDTAEINGFVIDEEVLSQFLSSLSLEDSERISPENAKIQKTDSGFEILPEVSGNSIDSEKLTVLIKEAVQEGETEIELSQAYAVPTVFSDDAELQAKLAELESLADLSLTYHITGSTENVPSETLLAWLNIDEANEITVDQDGIRAYLQELSSQYSTHEKERQFETTSRGTVTVPSGTYGWTLDVARETEALAADILEGQNVDRTPRYNGSGYAENGDEFGNTYVEVDLEEQHMWFYKDGDLVLETDIISGKPATATPAGVFYVWNKERNATLVGEDYETPVDYWLPVNWTGVGIHDSPWQSNYGGDTHLTRGSHGCINTPPGVMEQLYEVIEVGTPVIIYG